VTTYHVEISTLRGEAIAAWLRDSEAEALADARLAVRVGYANWPGESLRAVVVRVGDAHAAMLATLARWYRYIGQPVLEAVAYLEHLAACDRYAALVEVREARLDRSTARPPRCSTARQRPATTNSCAVARDMVMSARGGYMRRRKQTRTRKPTTQLAHVVGVRLAELDMRRSELAKKLGLSPQGVSTVLARVGGHRVSTLERLAKALDMPLIALMPDQPA
jgi:DNA-binding Xre family transcriptional regulator